MVKGAIIISRGMTLRAHCDVFDNVFATADLGLGGWNCWGFGLIPLFLWPGRSLCTREHNAQEHNESYKSNAQYDGDVPKSSVGTFCEHCQRLTLKAWHVIQQVGNQEECVAKARFSRKLAK